MYQELMPRVHRVITTQSVHPRAYDADKLVELAHRSGRSAEAIVPVEAALEAALEEAGQESVVLVTGSVFVAAAAREVLPQLVSAKSQ